MKTVFRNIILLSIPFALMSCSDVLDNTYSKRTAEGDLERIQAIRRLDSADYELLTDYMLKNGLIDPDLKHIDQSYKELLVLAKEAKIKDIKRKEVVKKIQDSENQFVSDHMDHMHQALSMIPEKSEIRKDWSSKNGIFYKMVFVNSGDKIVTGFKGKFAFYDAFDKEIKTVDITYNDYIKPADTLSYNAAIDFTNLNGGNSIYYTKDYKDLKIVWQPMKIRFEDGSILDHIKVVE